MKFRNFLRAARRFIISDPAWRKLNNIHRSEQVVGPLTYNQDGLATIHNCDFLRDERFSRAYTLGESTGSWGGSAIHWRAFVVCWAAQRGLALEGDYVECGVNRGGLARTVIAYVDLERTSRRFFLLDTFEGLVDRYISDEERRQGWRAGGYEECFDAVQRTFAPFPNVVLVRGAVPETLPQVTSEKIAFLSIDMNCAAPEIAAAECFWDRLSSGAVVVLDDYGWPKRIAQKEAFDQFAARRGVQVLALPTGQGLLFKP